MSETQAHSSEPPALAARGWFRWLRRIVNVIVPLGLGGLLVLSAWPGVHLEEGSKQRELHDDLVNQMRLVSLSQTWKMYAPDPSRGHFYMKLTGYDADDNPRELEENYLAEHGWGTAWAWRRSRLDIWQHAVTRRIDKVNRNRTWYMRGVCVREARREQPLRRIQLERLYRRIRSPEKVREGAALLSKVHTRKAQDSSCKVKIIRDMIETDHKRRARQEAGG